MSLPDYFLNDNEKDCECCGYSFIGRGSLCQVCRLDNIDLYADAAIQDAKEGKHG